MDRLTTGKAVSEMSMTELAYNSCYAKDRKAHIRDFENDFDARELVIRLLGEYADIPNEFTCDEDFDDFMYGSLQYGMDSIQGLIAVFYQNMWAMADLRERLKEYEDIGLTPKQLMEIDRLYAEKCRELADERKKQFSGMELVKIWGKLQQLKEYQGLEKQGKLLKLPCAVGDTVYKISLNHIYIDVCKITGFAECSSVKSMCYRVHIDPDEEDIVALSEFGKTAFLTREEAEAALKELLI